MISLLTLGWTILWRENLQDAASLTHPTLSEYSQYWSIGTVMMKHFTLLLLIRKKTTVLGTSELFLQTNGPTVWH